MHKSGRGLMALNLCSEEDLLTAFRDVRKAAGRGVPVLIQEMVKGGREFVAGMARFAGFGPASSSAWAASSRRPSGIRRSGWPP